MQLATKDAAAAKTADQRGPEGRRQQALTDAVLDRAWKELTVTCDPIASALKKSADNGVKPPGRPPKKVDLAGIYDLTPLNTVLKAQGLPPVSADGLGAE